MAYRTKAILISNVQASTYRAVVLGLVWFAAVLATWFCCQVSVGQSEGRNFESLPTSQKYFIPERPVYANESELSTYKREIRDAKRNVSTDNKAVRAILESNGNFDSPIVAEFLNDYLFPNMTRTENEFISDLGRTRVKFIKDFLGAKVSGGVRSQMINTTIDAMTKIATGKGLKSDKKYDLHTAARLNAIYIIGMIDDVAANRVEGRLPRPSAAGFDLLISVLASNDKEAFPDYLKVAAISGLQRHVKIDRVIGGQINQNRRQALTRQLVALLDAPGKDDKSYWMKRNAVQLIGELGDANQLDRVLAVLKSKDARWLLRLDAVQAIGRLNLRAVPADKQLEASVAISEFVSQQLRQESVAIEKAVAKLTYDAILKQDIDLEQKGVDFDADSPNQGSGDRGSGNKSAGSDSRGGGPGAGFPGGGFPGGGVPGGDFGAGIPGSGGFGAGPGGGSGTRGNGSQTKKLVELPGYQLNVFRRKIKALSYDASTVLGGETGETGLVSAIPDPNKSNVKQIFAELDGLLKDSNVGIIDASKRDNDDDDKESDSTTAQQLLELCEKSADNIDAQLRKLKGEAEPAAAPKEDQFGLAP